ncbi:MAG: LytTR family transcriptional regulator DNA-binding domain-containing protein [Verrucomicrobiota bacterium]
MLSVLLVHDADPDGLMRRQLAINHPRLRIAGMAASVVEAVEFLKTEIPDFVYLSWEMAGGLKAEVLNFLILHTRVVFVTAYGCHLAHALQPGTGQGGRKKTLESAALLGQSQSGDSGTAAAAREAVRRVLHPGLTDIVPLDEILWIEAAQNYSKVYRREDGQDILFHKSMGAWESILPSHAFRRLSRSVIIRVTGIRKLTYSGRDDTYVDFTGSEKQLRLGRAAALRLRAFFRGAR